MAITKDNQPTDLCVANTEEEAIEKFSNGLDEEGTWYASVYANEINEVDGYGIALIKNGGKLPKRKRIDC
jgi:hypothetical protein